ncbi:hypothetical protein THASP1DRAFT_27757 [Thamnocephalis sphaerospora]|uniref:CCHC-type domain-containing protein n=1 Tax=Thamnocephalis sphaerospora TaxID=78915 RepID=A0A4P9XVZ5_9FUNG|nr:hypothetical protein THASP1DRAFT_27757 [Thamnocephalis sphaerospora]|eukprot:RKP10475.1 hypothetical protein THASP1DRAFT_27757 [Thamnocephalis sphaerospora]
MWNAGDDDDGYEAYLERENELYNSGGDNSDSDDGVDSDVEEKMLSHVHYNTAARVASSKEPVPSAPVPKGNEERVEEPPNVAAASDDEDSVYSTARSKNAFTTKRPRTEAAGEESDDDDDSSDKEDKDKGVSAETQATNAATGGVGTITSSNNAPSLQITHLIQVDGDFAATADAVEGSTSADDAKEFAYLDEEGFSGRNRYFQGSVKETRACAQCGQIGHLRKDCTVRTCAVCGEAGHELRQCRFNGQTCHICKQAGHLARDCPRPRGYRGCPSLWRSYVYVEGYRDSDQPSVVYCYNCSVEGHYGDHCPMPRPFRFASEPTAFSTPMPERKRARLGTGHPPRALPPGRRGPSTTDYGRHDYRSRDRPAYQGAGAYRNRQSSQPYSPKRPGSVNPNWEARMDARRRDYGSGSRRR